MQIICPARTERIIPILRDIPYTGLLLEDILEEISGYIENIVFIQPENGFTVARLKEAKKDNFTTIVGFFPSLLAGESIKCLGEWKTHPHHGKQFEVKDHSIESPSDILGIQKYLESGLVKGVGPVYAKKNRRYVSGKYPPNHRPLPPPPPRNPRHRRKKSPHDQRMLGPPTLHPRSHDLFEDARSQPRLRPKNL